MGLGSTGRIIFITGITLVIYYMFWVDMWLHIAAGGGFMTVYSTVTFWGAQTILESVYMHHLTIFLIGVALTLAGGYLTPQIELSRAPSIVFGSVLYINGLWFFVWQLLEWGLTPELYRVLVEYWGGLYYAWGYHPVFPVVYWDRFVCLLVSLPAAAAGFAMLVHPFGLRSSAAVFALLCSAMVLSSNLHMDPIYLMGGLAALTAGWCILVRMHVKLVIIGLLTVLLVLGAGWSAVQPSVLHSRAGVFGGQPVFFLCEHLPDGWAVFPAYTYSLSPSSKPALTKPAAAVTAVNLKTGQVLQIDRPTLLWGGDWWLVSSMPFALQYTGSAGPVLVMEDHPTWGVAAGGW